MVKYRWCFATRFAEQSLNIQAQGRCAALSRSVPWSAVLARMHIGLPKIAYRAKCLQVFQHCLAPFAPRDYVVDMKLDSRRERRTRAARATSEAVTLKYVPAKAERWISASGAAGSFWARLNSGWLCTCAVGVINERFQ